MPGAPNRPPDPSDLAPPPPVTGTPAERILRRIAPSRIALHLDLWKGAPWAELLKPLQSAETALAAGDLPHAESALDQLAVRFAEPRWPTLPVPFRGLRQEIPPPMPPHWDPEHALAAPDREARKLHRFAELQLRLVEASVTWAQAHGVPSADLVPLVEEAKRIFPSQGGSASFWTSVDAVWTALRERVPMPTAGRTSTTPAASPTPPAPHP